MSDPDYKFQEKIRMLIEQNQLQEALELLKEKESERQTDAYIFIAQTCILGRLGKTEESVKAADKAIEIDPDKYEVHSMKGVSLYNLGKYEEAIDAFDECLKRKLHYPIAVQYKVLSQMWLEKYEDAIKTYESSDLPELHEETWQNNLGFIYSKTNEPKKAERHLKFGLRSNPLLSTLHLNLGRLYRMNNLFLSVIHYFLFFVFSFLERMPYWKKITKKKFRSHITEVNFFSRQGSVFSENPQKREFASILKLLTSPNAIALCNDTWEWFAVNIPYSAFGDKEFKGDIDLLLKRPRHFLGHDAGFTYRGFEVKTILVTQSGKVRSSKGGHGSLRTIKKQLKLLKSFGCEQVFLLEIYVLERGYAIHNDFPSKNIVDKIRKKESLLKNLGYGYVVMAQEPLIDKDEGSGGMWYRPINVLSAANNPIRSSFKKMTDGIDTFRSDEKTKSALSALSNSGNFLAHGCISYCKKCRSLTILDQINNIYKCTLCKAEL